MNEFAVFQFMPADLSRIRDFVADETSGNRLRGAVIKEDFQRPKLGAVERLWLAKCSTALTSSGVGSLAAGGATGRALVCDRGL